MTTPTLDRSSATKSAVINERGADPRHILRAARDDERRALASDLHDGPAQTLAYASVRLQTARGQMDRDPDAARAALEQAEAAVRDTLRQVRAIMGGLRPVALEEAGLVAALRRECEAANARGMVRMSLRVHGVERGMDEERETALYRAAREAVLNVERHAGAEQALVTLDFGPDALTITVQDDGRGLAAGAEAAARRAGRMGLATMRERLTALGGRMEARAAAGGGTRIALACPYEHGGDATERQGEPR